MLEYWWIQIFALLGALITELTLICARHLARKAPINYLILLMFTACETYLVSSTCIYYAMPPNDGTVMQAFVGTAMITLACTLYAFTTKSDFTTSGAIVWILAMTLLFAAMIFLPLFAWSGNWVGYDILICLIVMILGFFLIHDTQLIVGKGKWRLGIDDYILGAMILFVDIITIFLYLLELFGKKR